MNEKEKDAGRIVLDAANQIDCAVHRLLMAKDEPDARDAIAAIEGVTTLVTVTASALVDLAASVGRIAAATEKLVEISERDFKAAVDSEAGALAEFKKEEQTKRSFIGQKPK